MKTSTGHSPEPDPRLRLLTIKEAAVAIGRKSVSANTIRRAVHNGELKHRRLTSGRNGKILIPQAELVAWVCGEGRNETRN